MISQVFALSRKNYYWIWNRKFSFLFEMMIPLFIIYTFFKNAAKSVNFFNSFQDFIIISSVGFSYISLASNITCNIIHDNATSVMKHYANMGMNYTSYFLSYVLSNIPIMLLVIGWLATFSKGIIYTNIYRFILISSIGCITMITQSMLLGTFIPYESLAGMLSYSYRVTLVILITAKSKYCTWLFMFSEYHTIKALQGQIGLTKFVVCSILLCAAQITIMSYKRLPQLFLRLTQLPLHDISSLYKIYNDFKLSQCKLIFGSQFYSILGLNGSGKTTLINQLLQLGERGLLFSDSNHLIKPSEIGICAQFNIFFDYLTVKQHFNLLASFKHQNCSDEAFKIAEIDFKRYANELPTKLSGGEQRKLCISFAMLGTNKLIIFDEPTNSIDTQTRSLILSNIKQCALKLKSKIIITTNHADEISGLCDQIICVSDGNCDKSKTESQFINEYNRGYKIFLKINDNRAYNSIFPEFAGKSIIEVDNLLNSIQIIRKLENSSAAVSILTIEGSQIEECLLNKAHLKAENQSNTEAPAFVNIIKERNSFYKLYLLSKYKLYDEYRSWKSKLGILLYWVFTYFIAKKFFKPSKSAHMYSEKTYNKISIDIGSLVTAYNFLSFCPMIAETLFKDFSMISFLKVSGLRHTATIMGYFAFDCIRSILYTLLFLYIVCKQSSDYHIFELGKPLMLEVINIVLLTYLVTFMCIKRLKNYRVVYFILIIVIFAVPHLMAKYGVDHSFIEGYILMLPYFSVQTTIKSYMTSRMLSNDYTKIVRDMETTQYYQVASLMILLTLFTLQNIEFMHIILPKDKNSYAKNITKLYKKKKALDDVSFIIPENSTVALLGPNGAGKTTFIKLLTREIMPDKGFIILNGISSSSPQYEAIFDHVLYLYSSIYCIKTPFSIIRSQSANIWT